MQEALEAEFPVDNMIAKYMAVWDQIDKKVAENRLPRKGLQKVRSAGSLVGQEQEEYHEGQWQMLNTQVIPLISPSNSTLLALLG